MKKTVLINFIKKEFANWKKSELSAIVIILTVLTINSCMLKDTPIAIISAFCGIMYTIIEGKGKISCYLFGLTGSGLYAYLSFINNLYGNLTLYLLYYIPMQILGIFKWKKHLKKTTQEIYKTEFTKKNKIILTVLSIVLCIIFVGILKLLNDSQPLYDGTTTALSVVGMYLTVKRKLEQWIIWSIVNALAILMWFNVILSGFKAYSTLFMWSVYLILGIYFYIEWRKELKKSRN